jgi:hypothetical protein
MWTLGGRSGSIKFAVLNTAGSGPQGAGQEDSEDFSLSKEIQVRLISRFMDVLEKWLVSMKANEIKFKRLSKRL